MFTILYNENVTVNKYRSPNTTINIVTKKWFGEFDTLFYLYKDDLYKITSFSKSSLVV